MTNLLTVAVYSLKVSGDIPIQSEYIPLISLYFYFSIFFTLISMMWFIIMNNCVTRNKLPIFFIKLSSGIRFILYFSCKKEKNNEYVVREGCSQCINNKQESSHEIQSRVLALNLFISLLLLLFMVISDAIIWIKITNS